MTDLRLLIKLMERARIVTPAAQKHKIGQTVATIPGAAAIFTLYSRG